MIQSSTDRPDRRFWLRVKSTLASLYFALMFFVLGPGAILYLTREEPFAIGGAVAAVLGLLLVVAANLFVARHVALFIREGDGTHVPIDPPRRFVGSLAYQRLRNPMYLAYVVIAFGEAVFFGSFALVVYSGALWLVAHLYVVFREEPLLLQRFGEEYEQYCARVPRWGFGRRSRRAD
jgi:protein-S-isoprenylcysteine O-methyltransferase Ste14